MEFFQALILSIVEGITEFLPISSTGHLILVSTILQVPQTDFVKSFEIYIQLGAILAVIVLYWNTLFRSFIVWRNVITAFIPTAIVGLILYKLIKELLLGNFLITIIALFTGGVVMIILEKLYKEKAHQVDKIENLNLKQAALIGVCQSLSVIPGVSRSASSILGGMFLGANRQVAVEFSFLLAIPTMLAASGLDLIKSKLEFSRLEWMIIMLGFIGAFITALFVVKWFIKFVQKNNFIPFGVYRIIVSILLLAFVR